MPWPRLLPLVRRPGDGRRLRRPRAAPAVLAAAVLAAAGCSPGGGAGEADPVGVSPVEREVVFDSGPDTVHGTFALPPAHEGAVPAALIISGSGPTDRDGDTPMRPDAGTNLNFARVLAEAGVASLRYDKLGSGETGMGGRDEDDSVGYDVFEEQMAAAYAELADQPEVDPSRLLVLGHSEGALFALRSPEVVAEHPPAGLVLAAPPGTRYLDVLDRQVTGQARTGEASGLTRDEAEALLSDTRLAIARLRAGEPLPDDLSPGLDEVFTPRIAPFLREIDALDPAEMAADLPSGTPSLVLWGAEDGQVAETEVDRLTEALPDPVRVDLPATDHVFRRLDPSGEGIGAPDAQRPFSPDVAPALTGFLDTAL